MQVTITLFGSDGASLDELALEHAVDPPVGGVARMRVDTARPGWAIWYGIAVTGER